MFNPTEQQSYSLETFEGPLDFLVHLIQKKEIDIHDISIRRIIGQYLNRMEALSKEDVDKGAEFIGTTASLLYLKSKMLLPARNEGEEGDLEEEELDPGFDVIHHLLDYCRFKEHAKDLSKREDEQSGVYYRGIHITPTPEPRVGVEHLSLKDLEVVFDDVLVRAEARRGSIEEEQWRVYDKVRVLRRSLRDAESIPFKELFSPDRSKGELIVTFLAVLEMMKQEQLWVARHKKTGLIEVFRTQH